MDSAAGTIAILGIVASIALVIAVVYFAFKAIEFIMVSVKLYKQMVIHMEATNQILLDIRDNTKSFSSATVAESSSPISSSAIPGVPSMASADDLEALKIKYNITYDERTRKYIYKGFHYDELVDAVNYAQLGERRKAA